MHNFLSNIIYQELMDIRMEFVKFKERNRERFKIEQAWNQFESSLL